MENAWNFKIEVKDNSVFDKISEMLQIRFPEDLKRFIIEHNAASPEKNCIEVNGIEHIYGETLSFNEKEDEVLTVYDVMKSIECIGYIPFARDPFGNFFLYSIETGDIAFYLHEEMYIDHSKLKLAEMVDKLH